MTITTRRKLFYSLVALFIVVSGWVIAYSQGWRINWAHCTPASPATCVQKIGGIYIKTHPNNVHIAVGGTPFEDTSGVLRSGTLISNLIPRSYAIEVSKEGYLPWHKTVTVNPAVVTDVSHIILIPQVLKKEPIAIPKLNTLRAFNIYGDQRIVSAATSSLYYVRNDTVQKLRGDEFIAWNPLGNQFIVKDTARGTFYRYRTENFNAVLNISAALENVVGQESTIQKIAFHPFDTDKVIIQSSGVLYALNMARAETVELVRPAIPSHNVIDFVVADRVVYALTKTSPAAKNPAPPRYALISINLILGTETELAQLTLPEAPLTLTPSPTYAAFLVATNTTLYLVRPGEILCCTPIVVSPAAFAISPDGVRLAYAEQNGALRLYYIEREEGGEKHLRGEIIPLGSVPRPTRLVWHRENHHLFIETAEIPPRLLFVETDGVQRPNHLITTPAWHYESQTNMLYALDQGLLYAIDFLQE